MANILLIPPELFEVINDHLTFHDKITLSRTCKDFYQLLPDLYHSITIHTPFDPTQPKCFKPLVRLLRTLVSDEELTKRVHHLEIEGCNTQGWSPSDPEFSLSTEDARLLGRHIRSLGLPNPEQWHEAVVKFQNQRTIMALLLVHCQQLRTLKLDEAFLFDDIWLPELWSAIWRKPKTDQGSGRLPLPFRYLRDVEINSGLSRSPFSDSYYRARPTRTFQALFELTTIESLTLPAFKPCQEWEWLSLTPNLNVNSNLRRLKLPYCPILSDDIERLSSSVSHAVSPDDIEQLFMRTAQLRCLIIEWIVPCNSIARDWADIIGENLAGLEELSLSYDPPLELHRVPPGHNAYTIHSLGHGLHKLLNLRKLTIPWVFFYGTHLDDSIGDLRPLLPPNLETLEVDPRCLSFPGCNWTFFELLIWVERLLGIPDKRPMHLQIPDAGRAKHPKLKTFTFDARSLDPDCFFFAAGCPTNYRINVDNLQAASPGNYKILLPKKILDAHDSCRDCLKIQ